jgi:hypothetical protein
MGALYCSSGKYCDLAYLRLESWCEANMRGQEQWNPLVSWVVVYLSCFIRIWGEFCLIALYIVPNLLSWRNIRGKDRI